MVAFIVWPAVRQTKNNDVRGKMKTQYAILGSGMQGTAAAYDLAKFADAGGIRLGDRDLAQAQKAADRVNGLVGTAICHPMVVDALNPESLTNFLDGIDTLLSCVPYWMHPKIAQVAIAERVNMCDLGGNTEVTEETLAMDAAAKKHGVALVPDCGLAPGLVNSLGLYLIESFDTADSVKVYCGVLPQHPVPPFNYKLTFNVEGLVTEYDHRAIVLRDGEVTTVETLAEMETLHFDGFGEMEAFTTSGGTSTAPYTLRGRVTNYEYKTIRFPGHAALMRVFKDFGFWSPTPIMVQGATVSPLDFFCAHFGPKLAEFVDEDQCLIRAVGTGTKNGENLRIVVDIWDKQCPETGFTSMERLTGFSLSIISQAISAGQVGPGAHRYELAMTGTEFVSHLRERGIQLAETR